MSGVETQAWEEIGSVHHHNLASGSSAEMNLGVEKFEGHLAGDLNDLVDVNGLETQESSPTNAKRPPRKKKIIIVKKRRKNSMTPNTDQDHHDDADTISEHATTMHDDDADSTSTAPAFPPPSGSVSPCPTGTPSPPPVRARRRSKIITKTSEVDLLRECATQLERDEMEPQASFCGSVQSGTTNDTVGGSPHHAKVRARRRSRVGKNDSLSSLVSSATGAMGMPPPAPSIASASRSPSEANMSVGGALVMANVANIPNGSHPPQSTWRHSLPASESSQHPMTPITPGLNGSGESFTSPGDPSAIPPAAKKKVTRAKRNSLILQATESLEAQSTISNGSSAAKLMESTLPVGATASDVPPLIPGRVRRNSSVEEFEGLFKGMSLTPRPSESPCGEGEGIERGSSSVGSFQSITPPPRSLQSPTLYPITHSLSAFNSSNSNVAGTAPTTNGVFTPSPPISPVSPAPRSPLTAGAFVEKSVEKPEKKRFAGLGGLFSRERRNSQKRSASHERQGSSPGVPPLATGAMRSVSPQMLGISPRGTSSTSRSPTPTSAVSTHLTPGRVPLAVSKQPPPKPPTVTTTQKAMVQGVWTSCKDDARIEVHGTEVVHMKEGRVWKRCKLVEAKPGGKVAIDGVGLKQASRDMYKLVWVNGDMWAKEGGAKPQYRPASIEA